MSHGNVHQFVDEVARSGFANQKPDLLERIGGPGEENDESDADGTDGIEIPNEPIASNGHDETKEINGNIVSMVDLRCPLSILHQAQTGKQGGHLQRTHEPTGTFGRRSSRPSMCPWQKLRPVIIL